MKNKIIFLIVICGSILHAKASVFENVTDSIDATNLVIVRIEQHTENDDVIKLLISNQLSDTITLRSSFVLDNPNRASHILIYSCQYVDSVICHFDWPHNGEDIEPLVIKYANKKMPIAGNSTVSIEIPIRKDYLDTEIYLKVQFLFLYHNKGYKFVCETNKIHLTKQIQ